MTSATRTYAGASAADRRERRRVALLAAGLDLLGNEGLAKTTVRGVCTRARLNDRYFYESFPDRDTFVRAVFAEVASAGLAVILEAVRTTPRDPRVRIHATVTAIMDFLTSDPRRAHVLVLEAQSNEMLQQERRQVSSVLVTIFIRQARETLGPLPVTDLELTALTLVGGGWELIATWLRGDLSITRDHLIDFIVALILTAEQIATALDRELHP